MIELWPKENKKSFSWNKKYQLFLQPGKKSVEVLAIFISPFSFSLRHMELKMERGRKEGLPNTFFCYRQREKTKSSLLLLVVVGTVETPIFTN